MSDVDPADAFGALSDEVRVGILEALADRRRDHPGDPGMGFAELRKTVGVRDSGRFRYHLEELRDVFVEQDDDGTYRLNYAGLEVATAIVRGSYTERVRLGPADLDGACSVCGADATATYEDGVLDVACEDDHTMFAWTLPPNAAADATLEDLIETATLLMYQTLELTLAGTCPECHSAVATEVVPADGPGQPYRIRSLCDACGSVVDFPVGVGLVSTPELEALYRRHDRSIRRGYWWEKAFVGADADVERVEEDPLRVRVSVAVGDERLTATLDESGRAVETDLERE